MGLVNLVLLAVGLALIVVGAMRVRGPWARYQAMREQQANLTRYESWRGGIRGTPGEKTGADEMVRVLRVQAQREGLIVIAGFVLVIIAFVAKL